VITQIRLLVAWIPSNSSVRTKDIYSTSTNPRVCVYIDEYIYIVACFTVPPNSFRNKPTCTPPVIWYHHHHHHHTEIHLSLSLPIYQSVLGNFTQQACDHPECNEKVVKRKLPGNVKVSFTRTSRSNSPPAGGAVAEEEALQKEVSLLCCENFIYESHSNFQVFWKLAHTHTHTSCE